VVVWLSAFFSPTAYFLLLLLANKYQVPILPPILAESLLILIPAVALLVCGYVVWLHSKTVARKIGWMLFTLLAMLLQLAILAVIIRAILIVTIG
jgi:hypothetical protein